MIDWQNKTSAKLLRTYLIKPYRVDTLKYVLVFAVLWCTSVLLYKALDFFKPCDNTFFKSTFPALLCRLCEIVKLRSQVI